MQLALAALYSDSAAHLSMLAFLTFALMQKLQKIKAVSLGDLSADFSDELNKTHVLQHSDSI